MIVKPRILPPLKGTGIRLFTSVFIVTLSLLVSAASGAAGSLASLSTSTPSVTSEQPANIAPVWPMPTWSTATPAQVGMDEGLLTEARTYARGSGYITRYGKLVMSWGDASQLYDLKSTTKSIGATALGLAIKDNMIGLNDEVEQCQADIGTPPSSNADTGWLDKITVLHLATHTAGFDKSGGYSQLLFEPGTRWFYSDGGANWLAECLTLAYGQDLNGLMFSRVFERLGITPNDLTWRDNAFRPDTIDGIKRREFGAGISANVDAMARIGYLYLRNGQWNGEQIIPESFVNEVRTTVPDLVGLPAHESNISFGAPNHHGLLWWNNADGTLANVPRDAYWSWGLGESLIIVIPSLDIVVARAGAGWQSDWVPDYSVLRPFLEPIALSVNGQISLDNSIFLPAVVRNSNSQGAPYPPSPVITGLTWAPASTITRAATGNDTFPLTWAEDDSLYTAYADGTGFEPQVSTNLSLGFAKITGPATNFSGINIRSSDEQSGHGASGRKASGMLMVDGTLYMWVRNANENGEQCQLAWSNDYAVNWTWSSWKFTEFGYCTFINFGKNYAGARDNYVYVVTHDHPSAYEPADRFILMRVPKDQIAERSAYEFFEQPDGNGNPVWTSNISQRGAVFSNPGHALRSGISYNAALGRYVWWQQIAERNFDTRFAGGFGVYDSPEPWGPWTTVYYIEKWDVGPGETGSFPTKWMSADGKTMYLVFSGDDAFSVRKATLTVVQP